MYSLPLKTFLDDEHYGGRNFFQEGYSMLSMYLRSDTNYTVEEHLIDIGWRFRKQSFVIKCRMDTPDQARIRKILTWVMRKHTRVSFFTP